jgi:MFS transporter, MHS family, shikimate and dehydroshikimate transport protein
MTVASPGLHGPVSSADRLSREQLRVGIASFFGNAVEQYDFFGYGTGAALAFPSVFYPNVSPTLATFLAFATFAVGYFFRPLGSVVFGHLGDRLGRKRMLIVTLLMMGVGSTIIGLIPSYATIGVAAPLLLLAMRALQGFAIGGEGAGAVLMAVEHAPPRLRGLLGAFPQIGVSGGVVVANLIFLLMSVLVTHDQFLAWGWRVPFLFSVVLVGIGTYIRLRIAESPVFETMIRHQDTATVPIATLFRKRWKPVVQLIVALFYPNTQGYIFIFMLAYGTRVLHLPQPMLLAFSIAANLCEVPLTLYSGFISDRFGRKRVVLIGLAIGAIIGGAFFPLVDTREPLLVFLAMLVMRLGIATMYGPIYTMFSEQFDTNVRFSGIAIGNAISGLIGAQIPAVAALIMTGGSGTRSMSIFLFCASAVAFINVALMRVEKRVDLSNLEPE